MAKMCNCERYGNYESARTAFMEEKGIPHPFPTEREAEFHAWLFADIHDKDKFSRTDIVRTIDNYGDLLARVKNIIEAVNGDKATDVEMEAYLKEMSGGKLGEDMISVRYIYDHENSVGGLVFPMRLVRGGVDEYVAEQKRLVEEHNARLREIQAKEIEAKERAEYERLKAKFEGGATA